MTEPKHIEHGAICAECGGIVGTGDTRLKRCRCDQEETPED